LLIVVILHIYCTIQLAIEIFPLGIRSFSKLHFAAGLDHTDNPWEQQFVWERPFQCHSHASRAIRSGSMLFCAGQIPLDPKTGQIVSDDISEQAKRVLENISAILSAEHLNFEHVVKTTIFLTSMGDFQAVNEIYATYFRENLPARSTWPFPRCRKAPRWKSRLSRWRAKTLRAAANRWRHLGLRSHDGPRRVTICRPVSRNRT